jgi:hypothetical protein
MKKSLTQKILELGAGASLSVKYERLLAERLSRLCSAMGMIERRKYRVTPRRAEERIVIERRA